MTTGPTAGRPIVLITGSSSGIGQALARELHGRGARALDAMNRRIFGLDRFRP